MHQYLSLSGLMVACPGYPDIQLRSLSVQASDEVPEELVVQTAREYVNGLGKIGEIMRFQERIIKAIRAPVSDSQRIGDMVIVEIALRQKWLASEIFRSLQWKAEGLGF